MNGNFLSGLGHPSPWLGNLYVGVLLGKHFPVRVGAHFEFPKYIMEEAGALKLVLVFFRD